MAVAAWSCASACLFPCLVLATSAFGGDLRWSERDKWQKPDEVVSALALRKGQVVADIGAGAGYFTLRLARAVGPGGKVYAVDIASHVLDFIGRQARKEGLGNVETVVSKKDDPLLRPRSVDVAFLCETIHEIDDRPAFYRKVRAALKPAARMVLIDSNPIAGAPEGRQVLRATAVREAESAGFRLVGEETFLPRQYFLIFRKR